MYSDYGFEIVNNLLDRVTTVVFSPNVFKWCWNRVFFQMIAIPENWYTQELFKI